MSRLHGGLEHAWHDKEACAKARWIWLGEEVFVLFRVVVYARGV